jgi:hypothetical protein
MLARLNVLTASRTPPKRSNVGPIAPWSFIEEYWQNVTCRREPLVRAGPSDIQPRFSIVVWCGCRRRKTVLTSAVVQESIHLLTLDHCVASIGYFYLALYWL